jgi:hypothetical protein
MEQIMVPKMATLKDPNTSHELDHGPTIVDPIDGAGHPVFLKSFM